MNWCLENTLPEDVDVNLFKCYGKLSIMEGDWNLTLKFTIMGCDIVLLSEIIALFG
jgi:hypothetical protein